MIPAAAIAILSGAALAGIAALLAMPTARAAAPAALVLAAVALWPAPWLTPQPSPYKELSQVLRVPGARIAAERSSPLAQLTVVTA